MDRELVIQPFNVFHLSVEKGNNFTSTSGRVT